MILPEEIKKLAEKAQTVPLNISRDYLQTLFLLSFYQQKEAAPFFFKGGTALHLVFQSPRYSEDLDFSATVFNCRLFEELLNNSLLEMEKSGFTVDLIESKPTTGGCLAIFSALMGTTSLRIQLEVSLRTPKQANGETVILKGPFFSPFNVQILTEEELTAGKVSALLTRKKPRDFYDLYFILRAGVKIKLSKEQRLAIVKTIYSLKQEDLNRDLREFLPKSHRSILKDLPQTLKTELERFIR